MATGFQYSENSAFSPVPFDTVGACELQYGEFSPPMSHHHQHLNHQHNIHYHPSSIHDISSNNLEATVAATLPHNFHSHHDHHAALLAAEYELRHTQPVLDHLVNNTIHRQSPPFEAPPSSGGTPPYGTSNNHPVYFTYPPYLQECLASGAGSITGGIILGEPGFIRKRNERERLRVRNVNEGYARLRDHLPLEPTEKRLSKVETLRGAIKYIKLLQTVLRDPGTKQQSQSSSNSYAYSTPNVNSNNNNNNIPSIFSNSSSSLNNSNSTNSSTHLMLDNDLGNMLTMMDTSHLLASGLSTSQMMRRTSERSDGEFDDLNSSR